MRIDLVYLWVAGKCHESMPDPEYYTPFHHRFAETFLAYGPKDMKTVRFHLVFCGKVPPQADRFDAAKLPYITHTYFGPGKDIGAHQKVSYELHGDFAVFFASVSYAWKGGWLGRLVEAFKKYGNGLYGPMASYENSPHIRTSCFACPPTLLAQYPVHIDTVDKCVMFESCQGGFTDWVSKQGLPVKMVTWDGEYDQERWRDPALTDIFRRGDQSNCLTLDRHTDIFRDATTEEKARLSKLADGYK